LEKDLLIGFDRAFGPLRKYQNGHVVSASE